jgi:2,4-dienoyl-CoA reductase-like NADH-dependent reductase (Old Yellow Enzyme family)
MTSFGSPDRVSVTGLDPLLERFERGEFDLVAIGRALIANPEWPRKVQAGALEDLRPFDRSILASLL